MKIAVDISVLEFPPSGIARVVLGLYEACFRLDPTLEIFGVHRNSLQCDLPEHFRDHQWVPWIHRRFWRRAGLPTYLRVKKPDVIHFPWNSGVVRPHRKCTTVLTIHDVIHLALPETYLKTSRDRSAYCQRMQDALDKADIVLTDSEASKRDILKYLSPRTEPVVIYPGLSWKEMPLQDRRSQSTEQGRYFIFQGGYHSRKGLQQLVPAFRDAFRNKQVRHPLVLVGESDHSISPGLGDEIDAGIREGALVEKGYVTDEELSRLMKNARALIYPSHYEGFGLPLLEAMSVGCPVVTCNVSSMPEVCGDAAIYVDPGSQEQLAQAIIELESSDDRRRELRERGFAQAKKFSWEKSASKYLDTLKQFSKLGENK